MDGGIGSVVVLLEGRRCCRDCEGRCSCTRRSSPRKVAGWGLRGRGGFGSNGYLEVRVLSGDIKKQRGLGSRSLCAVRVGHPEASSSERLSVL